MQSVTVDKAKMMFDKAVGFIKAKQYPSAKSLLNQVLKIVPNHGNSHQLLSVIALEQGHLELALTSMNAAIANQSRNFTFYYNRAMIYHKLHRLTQAISDLEQAIAINPSYHPAYLALARIFYTLEQFSSAITYYEHYLKWINTDESIWNDLSSAYLAIHEYAKALKCNDISLQLNPHHEKTYATRGKIYQLSSKWDEAVNAYTQALALNPNDATLFLPLFICKSMICEWDDYEKSVDLIKQAFKKNPDLALNSFNALSLPFTAREQHRIAKNENKLIKKSLEPSNQRDKFKRDKSHHRLRIAYISSSFRDYPTGHLTQDLYASHDRNQFEVYAYSYGKDDGSIYRKKIEKGCDHFIDISDYSIEQACEQIQADKIDILIDLMGFTANTRLKINALRPAPINVRYLGSPMTSGADYFDYFISDGFITPPSEQPHFSEHLVLMPDTYQVNPIKQSISRDCPTRAECGLPETGIVFCAFNNCFKIEPQIFEVWMNILNAVSDSVLWLQAGDIAQNNLIKQAKRYNIAANRLIFADRMAKDKHLARHTHADIYLDTYIYNAHTTASDALWANVPVITCPRDTFQSRVAGSLLNCLGLNELIMPDLKTYESTAIALALDPAKLKKLKSKLKKHCQTYPLFDTKRFVDNLEKAYLTMWEQYKKHEKSLIMIQA